MYSDPPEYSGLVSPYLPPKEEVWGLITSLSLLTHSGYRWAEASE